MRKIVLSLLVGMPGATVGMADTYVNGHYRQNGTYVQGHYKSNANSFKHDNYSTKGNTNPYTGKKGTKNPW